MLLLVSAGGGYLLAGKGFSSPAQFKGEDVKNALIRNWRNLTTFINTWVVRTEPDGQNVVIEGALGVNGNAAATPDITGSRGSNAALASLLSALEDQGYITDSTTS